MDTAQIDEGLGRILTPAKRGDPALGLLKDLPGKWVGKGRGWNMIALPVDQAHAGGQQHAFRLLLNQFDETLEFTNELVGSPGGVPNRGTPTDQFLNGLQYIQHVDQLVAVDSLGSNISLIGKGAIHHEPGFFLSLLNDVGNDPQGRPLNLARLGSVPHGDSLAALGNGIQLGAVNGINITPGAIGDFSPLPIGAGAQDIQTNAYLKPYLDFHNHPFKGNVTAPGFPGFDPSNPLALLQSTPPTPFKSMVVIVLDTANRGGISNLPFVTDQANATEMRFVIWVEELQGSTPQKPKFQLQYAQRVLLDFFPQFGNPAQKIRWPHISINTLTLQTDDDGDGHDGHGDDHRGGHDD